MRNLPPDLADAVPTSVKLSHDPGDGRVTGHVGTQRARGPGLDRNVGLKAAAWREPNPERRVCRPGRGCFHVELAPSFRGSRASFLEAYS